MRRAIYPGSFDPITNGHLDIIERGCKLFDEIIIGILVNPEKQPFFTIEERHEMLNEVLKEISRGGCNVRVDSFRGLLVNYAVSLLMTNLIPNMWYIHATLIGILSSISTNFLLNKIWTFEDRDFSTRHIIKQYFLFLAFCSFGAVIQLTLISIFVDYYHIQYAVSLIMAVAVASIGNFLLNKKITFGERIWE